MRKDRRRELPANLYGLIWRRSARLQVAVIALGLLGPPLAIAPLEIQRRIVDDAIPGADFQLLAMLGAAFAAALALRTALKFAIYYLRGLIEAKITRDIRRRVIDAQMRRAAPAARASAGPVNAIVAEEAYPLGGFAAQALNTPLVEGGALFGVVGFMGYTEPVLAAIGVAALALEAVVVPIVQTIINRMSARRVRAIRRASADILDASERTGGALWRDALRETRLAYRLRVRMNVFKAALKAFSKLVEKSAVVVVLMVGGAMVIAGETTLGVVVAFLSGFRQLRPSWDELLVFYRNLADAFVKYRLIRAAMGAEIARDADVDPGPALAIELP